MSRFESSKFIRNGSVMRQDCLIAACDKLGWQYKIENDTIYVTDFGIGTTFGFEYAIKVEGTTVTYNTYYFDRTKEYVKKLQDVYNVLNVEYSKTVIIKAFKKNGFTFKSNPLFVQTDTEKESFFMVGRSSIKNEDEPVGQIKFTILYDGTIISDSDYLPEDVNKRAHASMDEIDDHFSSSRVMTRKEIPVKYRHKVKRDANNHVVNIK
ncbi:MAG: hypothetical protein IJV81_08260 [Paludibacteraceae bacterium]|nr:hypothetical protein [Paludibacteraceae bacterium]